MLKQFLINQPGHHSGAAGNRRYTSLFNGYSPTRRMPAKRITNNRIMNKPSALAVFLRLLLAGLFIYLSPGVFLPNMAMAASDAPRAVGVLRFEDIRRPEKGAWLGMYLQEALSATLRRANRVAVMDSDAAVGWKHRHGLSWESRPTPEQLKTMNVDALVQGSTQTVLALTEIKLRITGPAGTMLEGEKGHWRINLQSEPPGQLVKRMAEVVFETLLPGYTPVPGAQPKDWEAVEMLYGMILRPPWHEDKEGRKRYEEKLAIQLKEPELRGRAHQALAQFYLERAMLELPDGMERRAVLTRALDHIRLARNDDPLETDLQAIKAELHYFLKEDYQAKTEASVARIKNPLNGLAHAVLGLVAGLSTGEGTQHLQRSLLVNPFLGLPVIREEAVNGKNDNSRNNTKNNKARPVKPLGFQQGVLVPYYQKWLALREQWMDENDTRREGSQDSLMTQGVNAFEAGRYDEARPLFEDLALSAPKNAKPRLYLYRILTETGRPDQAVPLLKQLRREFPGDMQVAFHLGEALERTDKAKDARKVYQLSLARNPKNIRILLRLAYLDMSEDRWNAALQNLERLLGADRKNMEGWMAMGTVKSRQKNWQEAQTAYQMALAINPDSVEARAALKEIRQRAKSDGQVDGQQQTTSPSTQEDTQAGTEETQPPGVIN